MEEDKIIQIGLSLTADFETNEWTFRMPEGFEVTRGEYVIIKKSDFDELIRMLRVIALSMEAHPDYQTGRNQEFIDYVELAQEQLDKFSNN